MGKNYTAVYAELDGYKAMYCKALKNCQQSLGRIDAAISALAASGNISGATADRMRNYFNDIHGRILASLTKTVSALDNLFPVYVSVYLGNVDAGPDFYIPSNSVRSIQKKMSAYLGESIEIDAEAEEALKRISGIFSPPCALVVTDPHIYTALSDDITKMFDALDEVESSYKDLVESTVSELITSTRQTIQANINQDKMHKKTYSAADNGVEYFKMVGTTEQLAQVLDVNKGNFDAARDTLEQYNKKQEEYHKELAAREKRENEVKMMKIGLTVLKAAAGVAVICLTGGAGTAFVVATIAVGAGGGALGGGLDAFGEQYIEGGTDNLDWGKIGRKALIGGIKGGVTSAITVGIGAGFNQIGDAGLIADLGYGSSALVKGGLELGSKIVEDECTKIIGNGIGRFIDASTEDWVNKGGAFSLDVDKGMDSAFDEAAILHDAVETLADTTMSFGAEKLGEGVFGMGKITKDTQITPQMVGKYAFIGTASEVGSGIFSRGAGTLAEDLFIGMSFDEAMDDATKQSLDGDKVFDDAVSGFIKGGSNPITGKIKAIEKDKKNTEELEKNMEEEESANSNRERRIIQKLHETGEWDDIEEEDEKIRKNVNSGNTARERRILADMDEKGEAEPTGDRSGSALTEDEKTRIIEDFVDQNVTKARLPRKNGHWSDPSKPGDSMWIPDDEATFTYKQDGKVKTMTYGELKAKYNIEGIEYRNNDPVFNTPQIADQNIGKVDFDRMPTERQGKGGSYEKFYGEADKRLGSDSETYMKEKGLTVHESADRKTVVAIPTEINAAFPHTGAISEQRSLEAVSEAWDEKSGGRGYSLSRGNTPTGTMKGFDSDKINKTLRQFYSSYKKK